MALKLSDFQKIPNTPRPTAGMGLTLDANGTISPSVVALRAQHVNTGGNVTVTATASPGTDVGASLTLAEVGTYLVVGVFDFDWTGSPGSMVAVVGELNLDGFVQIGVAVWQTTAAVETDRRATVPQLWLVTTTAPDSKAKLAAWKTAALGTAVATGTHTTLTSLRVA